MIRSGRQRIIELLARRWPQPFYGAVGRVSRLSTPVMRRQARVQRIRSVFAHMTEPEARRAERDLRCSMLKSRALGVALSRTRGEPVFPPVAVGAAFADVRGPAVLTTFHVGPVGAIGEVVRRVPGEITALHRMDWRFPSNVAGVYVDDTDMGQAAAFYHGVSALRRGGCVLILGDGPPGHEVSLLGRVTTLKRGPYALARITGAPIVPLVARWTGASVDIVCGRPIQAIDDEAAMAQAMAAVLERHLLEHPGEIGDHLLSELSRAPRRTSRPAP